MTQWTVAHQAPPSMEFSRQEYWSGLPFPSAGDLPNPGIKPGSPALWVGALQSEPRGWLISINNNSNNNQVLISLQVYVLDLTCSFSAAKDL